TGESTRCTAGVRDPASKERFSEITSGSSRGQQRPISIPVASRVCLDGDLPGRTYAPAQRAARAGCRGAPLAEQLSGPEGGDRDRLRAQSCCCVRTGPHRRGGGSSMIEMRRAQLSFGDEGIGGGRGGLRENWVKQHHAGAGGP